MRRISLPVALLVLILAACSTRPGLATPSLPMATRLPTSGIPSTPEESFTETPVPSATNTSIPPPLPVLASPVLDRIDFQDENNGWGIAVQGSGQVVRTVDGGRSWLNATPPESGRIGLSASLTVLNTNTVWVLVPSQDFFAGTLFRTSDGGVSWKSNPVPFGGGFVQFMDARTGRVLAARGAAAGSEAVELFQTSDGGASWTSVFHNDPTQPGSSDSLPLAGIKNGMTFLDANTGWVTGSIPVDGEVYLYLTHDGGSSWTKQSLPLPPTYISYQYLPQAPVFFGQNGFLPLTIYLHDTTILTCYATHDGGATWNGDPSDISKDIQPGGLITFADSLHGYVWDGSDKIYSTKDGAQTWTAVATAPNLNGRLQQIEFVPPPDIFPIGWALTGLDESGHSQLYHTTDGLQWEQIIP